jgi:protein-tyrosine-phosphatase
MSLRMKPLFGSASEAVLALEREMAPTARQFNLRIWTLALGYFCFYAPYSGLIKVVTTGLWPGITGPVSGFQLLPSTVISTAIALPLVVSLLGWWTYASRRPWRGIHLPCPGWLALLSGLGTAIIIGTTTLAYTSTGVSILLALLLLRGGVLVIAPTIDFIFKRRVRWFSWVALGLAMAGVLVALADVSHYRMTQIAALNIAAYLTGYLLRLPCMNSVAKCGDQRVALGYLVEEQMVAASLLVAMPAIYAAFGTGLIATELRGGFTGFFTSSLTVPGILVGALYACLYFFGTLIYLDRRENSFCIPLNRCASVLSGIAASYVLTLLYNQPAPSVAQLGSAGLIIVALLLLSPLHHVQHYAGSAAHALREMYLVCRRAVARWPVALPEPAALGLRRSVSAAPENVGATDEDGVRAAGPYVVSGFSRTVAVPDHGPLPVVGPVAFLFVCSGNTCRSPMAAAIGNAEIAARFRTPFDRAAQAPVQALSAGVSARVGAPMTPESLRALETLGIPSPPHRARNVTAELVSQVEKIFCMTTAHRSAVIDLVPAAAVKTECLDPDGDIEDPIGRGLPAYVSCAQRIHSLVQLRFDELSLHGGLQGP